MISQNRTPSATLISFLETGKTACNTEVSFYEQPYIGGCLLIILKMLANEIVDLDAQIFLESTNNPYIHLTYQQKHFCITEDGLFPIQTRYHHGYTVDQSCLFFKRMIDNEIFKPTKTDEERLQLLNQLTPEFDLACCTAVPLWISHLTTTAN